MPLPRSSRHATHLRAEDTLLLITDMQEPFLRNIYQRDRVIKNATTMVLASPVLRLPIVLTQQNTPRLGNTIPEISQPLRGDFIPFDKLTFSSMNDDAVHSEVRRSGRKQILICGVETHICIMQTTLDLMSLGYQVHVIADAVGSRTEANWEIGLARMEQAGALISSTEMAMFELLGEAGTLEFKLILEMIK
ncbi:MAG: hydrolase [Chthonomonadales bacterium]